MFIRTALIASLVLLAVYAQEEAAAVSKGPKRVGVPKKDGPRQGPKKDEKFAELVAKLSPEAKEVHKKIVDAVKESKEALGKTIKAIVDGASESVKKELEPLRPKSSKGGFKPKGSFKPKGESKGEKKSDESKGEKKLQRPARRTTVAA